MWFSAVILAPSYLSILPAGSSPTGDLDEFLSQLARRMGMVVRHGQFDYQRAATFFIDWWRKKGGLAESADATVSHGWGFDFQWPADGGVGDLRFLMDRCHREFEEQAETEEKEGNMISDAQKEKTVQEEKARERAKRVMGQDAYQKSRRTIPSSSHKRRR